MIDKKNNTGIELNKKTVLHKDKKVNLISVTKGRIKRLGYLCCIKL